MLSNATHLEFVHLSCYQTIFIVFGHCLENDNDFSMRWGLIKGYFSRQCQDKYKEHQSASRLNKGEQGVWQQRFWEHQIRDEVDFIRHVEYIHYNLVKHGLVNSPNA